MKVEQHSKMLYYDHHHNNNNNIAELHKVVKEKENETRLKSDTKIYK